MLSSQNSRIEKPGNKSSPIITALTHTSSTLHATQCDFKSKQLAMIAEEKHQRVTMRGSSAILSLYQCSIPGMWQTHSSRPTDCRRQMSVWKNEQMSVRQSSPVLSVSTFIAKNSPHGATFLLVRIGTCAAWRRSFSRRGA